MSYVNGLKELLSDLEFSGTSEAKAVREVLKDALAIAEDDEDLDPPVFLMSVCKEIMGWALHAWLRIAEANDIHADVGQDLMDWIWEER